MEQKLTFKNVKIEFSIDEISYSHDNHVDESLADISNIAESPILPDYKCNPPVYQQALRGVSIFCKKCNGIIPFSLRK